MGFFECDDGNTWSGDGCSHYCEIETGYECYGGSPSSADVCYQICGDGMVPPSRPGESYCDDGNNEDGDGCDSECQAELGFCCCGGSIYQPDVCLEICGDGLNFGF